MREEGLRIPQFSVLTGFGRPNAERSIAEGLARIIPLEELTARTFIIDVQAVSQIKIVTKFDFTCWAVHRLVPVKNDVHLLGYSVPFISYALFEFCDL